MQEAGDDEDSSSCVDLSQVPPCWRCTAAVSMFMLANLITCVYVGSHYFKTPAHVEHPAEPISVIQLQPPASLAQEEAEATPFRTKLRSREKEA